MSANRLRIFAGPNGSGKSTLFEAISSRYNAGIFLNADLIEKEIAVKGFLDLTQVAAKDPQFPLVAGIHFF